MDKHDGLSRVLSERMSEGDLELWIERNNSPGESWDQSWFERVWIKLLLNFDNIWQNKSDSLIHAAAYVTPQVLYIGAGD